MKQTDSNGNMAPTMPSQPLTFRTVVARYSQKVRLDVVLEASSLTTSVLQ